MANQKKQDNEKWGALILGLVLLFAGAALFLKPDLLQESSNLSSIEKDASVDESINRNLKAADIRRQLEVLKVQIENERAEKLREVEAAIQAGKPSNLKLKQESHAESVVQELEEYEKRGDEGYLDPSDIVERRIARDQVLADYDRKYKKEYIKSFLRNAREQGLEVELNEDLEVIGIREAPLDEPMRFPNSVSGQGSAAQ